ncbi:MAG: DUF2442 domain-containing protein [Candidatus Saccharibacteria bacterium]|nr:DUF2442 domain-containing protein [Candidatus Saccharibacteria bacterium]
MMNIVKVWVDREYVHILTEANKELRERVADYKRLREAADTQLQDFEIDPFGIHWPQLDEDLCFDCFPKA